MLGIVQGGTRDNISQRLNAVVQAVFIKTILCLFTMESEEEDMKKPVKSWLMASVCASILAIPGLSYANAELLDPTRKFAI